jgi:hypothetical protein
MAMFALMVALSASARIAKLEAKLKQPPKD